MTRSRQKCSARQERSWSVLEDASVHLDEATECRYPVSPSRKQWSLGVVGIDPRSAEANALSDPPGEYDRKVKTQRN